MYIKLENLVRKKVKQMKRNWKNFRLDPNKVYQIIGQAVVYTAGYLAGIAFCYWGILQATVYR